jgi:cation diffusion facilitator CzcD-associated flavoprotein CzcO
VGAGLSGIGAACHLAVDVPGRSYAILEARETSGGTWDLFRYPGVRSDSDMYTLGYRFRPWQGDQALADGPSILRYLRETAAEYGVDERVQLRPRRYDGRTGRRPNGRWTVTAEHDGDEVTLTCDVLWACSGYYDYDEGYTPEFAGVDDYEGRVVHPQHWPDDLDLADQRVVVIGSGATAMTLVPAIAAETAHVTMLQRSPTYVLSVPSRDGLAARARRLLPGPVAYGVTRWKNVLLATGLYQLSQRRPDVVRRLIRKGRRPSCRTGTTSTPTSARRTTPGTSACAWCPTGTCSGRSAGATRRS